MLSLILDPSSPDIDTQQVPLTRAKYHPSLSLLSRRRKSKEEKEMLRARSPNCSTLIDQNNNINNNE